MVDGLNSRRSTGNCITFITSLAKCTRLGCINKSESKGLCTAHLPQSVTNDINSNRRVRPDYHKLYNTAYWIRGRIAFLSNKPLCSRCKKYNYITPATDVDHIISHKGDTSLFYDKNNWQGLCHSCHSWKTQREGVAPWSDLDFSDYF